MRFVLSLVLVTLFLTSTVAFAQDFQLVEPSGVVSADVYLSPAQMTVNDANRKQYLFNRDRSFDSYDGRYQGYLHPALNRVVRFPRSGSGLMQVTDLDDVRPRYVYSRRSVRRASPNRGQGPGNFGQGLGHFGQGLGHFGQGLGHFGQGLGHFGHAHYHGFAFIPPVFHHAYGYPSFGFGYPMYGYGYQSFGTTLSVGPVGGGIVYRPRYFYPPPIQSILLDSQIIPRQPLPPVTLNLLNSARREMRVTVNDRVTPDQSKQLRIAPGTAASLLVQRDAGADRVRRVRTYAPNGSEITREISTPIAPGPRYELVVHEWRLQSVAIDRTGKSPNVIEDSRFQGRGLGRFELPPGDQVTGGTIDVVQAAVRSNNAGSVAPMLDDTNPRPGSRPVSPLEAMILEQRRASGR